MVLKSEVANTKRAEIYSHKPTSSTQSFHLQELVPSNLRIPFDHVTLVERQRFAATLV